MRRIGKSCLAAVVAGAGLALLAGSAVADISGYVYHGKPGENGELIPLQGAMVSLKDNGTTATAYTNHEGHYHFPGEFTGANLDVVVMKGTHLAAKAENASDGEYHFNLSPREGVSISELHSAFFPGYNSAVHNDRHDGNPIQIYLDNILGTWTPENIAKIEDIIQDINTRFGYERYVFTDQPRDGTNTFGINLLYNPNGSNKADPWMNWSDLNRVWVRRANVEINSFQNWNLSSIHREICAKSNGYDGANYSPSCAYPNADLLSDKDILYITLCDGWRIVAERMAEIGRWPCHTLYSLTDPEIPTSTQETSWGGIKGIHKQVPSD